MTEPASGELEKKVNEPLQVIPLPSIRDITMPIKYVYAQVYVEAPTGKLPKAIMDLRGGTYAGDDRTIDFGFSSEDFELALPVLIANSRVVQSVMFSDTMPTPFPHVIAAYAFNGSTSVKTDLV